MNAIIIAAGKGTRLQPITFNTPKPLIKVFEQPMLERSIEFLIEKGINEIIIVVGYLKEKFLYLKEKYPQVRLVYNDKYSEYNNIYSFYLIRDYLEDSYILDGDLYIVRNLFKKNFEKSMYLSKKLNFINNEWQLIEKEGKVLSIEIGGENNYIMSGISFWKQRDSKKLKKLVEKYILDKEKKEKYYWDHIVKENLNEFDIGVHPISEKDIYEIDTIKELNDIDSSYQINNL